MGLCRRRNAKGIASSLPLFLLFAFISNLKAAIANITELPPGVCPDPVPPPPPPPPPVEVCPTLSPPPPPPVEVCPVSPSLSPPPPPPHPPPPPPPPPPSPKHPPPPPPSPKYPPPPPPSPKHPPPPPLSPEPAEPPKNPDTIPIELRRAIDVIRRFKKTITYDPLGKTKTWVGEKICTDESTYEGFNCDTTIDDGKLRVALVNFNGFNFDGNPLALTNFLDDLTDLIVFHANSNNFTGKVPGGINRLFELDLSNNELKGEFPETILTGQNLTFLDVRFNHLTGTIPPKAFTLDLDVLYLNNNQFTGSIPESIGDSPVLYLTLANNLLQSDSGMLNPGRTGFDPGPVYRVHFQMDSSGPARLPQTLV